MKVLIITPNPLHNGPRLVREIDALKSDFKIVAVGKTPPHDPSVFFIPFDSIQFSLIDRIIRKIHQVISGKPYTGNLPFKKKRIHKLLRKENPDIVIAHYPIELPYLFSFPGRTFKVVYNAHEYHPLEFDSNEEWRNTWGRLYAYIYKTYLNQVDLLVNVCDSIAYKCIEQFGKHSIVVPNAASYNATVKPVQNITEGPIRIIHHGGSIVDRKIELMIDAVAMLGDDYTLDLMLIPANSAYHDFLIEKVRNTKNVQIIEPVNFEKIVPFINQYDIGLFNLPPDNYNYAVALPNKLFEFIQARLCIVVSPSVEMKKIVEKYELGKVSLDFTPDSIAQAIRQLTKEEIYNYKLNADKVASLLSAEVYQGAYLKAIQDILA